MAYKLLWILYLKSLVRSFKHDYKDVSQLKDDIIRLFLISKKSH